MKNQYLNYIKYNYNKKEKFPKFILYYNYNLIINILISNL